MKLHEITDAQSNQERLDEISWKNAVASGIMAGAAMMGPKTTAHSVDNDWWPALPKIEAPNIDYSQPKLTKAQKETNLVQSIVSQYKVSPQLAQQVVSLAHKYEDPLFPRAEDILSIVGIESSFNPDAVSALKTDPARGLMQVRPGAWGLDPTDLDSVEEQIRYGAKVLSDYYEQTGSRSAAIKAFNVGLKNYRTNKQPDAQDRYWNKYQDQRQRYRAGANT